MNGVLARGGGGSSIEKTLITLTASNWVESNGEYTYNATVEGVLADESVQLICVMPAASSLKLYMTLGVYVSSQATNQLIFTSSGLPEAVDLEVYVTIQEA